MRPLNKHCIIAPELHPEKVGSIHLPKNLMYRDLPQIGKVLFISEGKFDFKVGERVVYDRHKSNIDALKVDGKMVALVPCDAVMAILT